MKKIDLRSDTVTLPSEEMYEAMRTADLGDDVYNEDPTVTELQHKAAKMLGKEAALFVSSGTMGNICGVVGQTKRGDEIIVEQTAHIFQFEQGSSAVIGGVHTKTVIGKDGYLITPEMLEEAIRAPDVHHPISSLVSMENTHNMAGGKVWTKQQTQDLIKTAKKHNLKVHIDGARIFNAAVALGVPVNELVKGADSVMFCLSKGLACPIGSIIAGSQEFIDQAYRVRKLLGGGMRQVGIIAAPGIVALDSMIDRLADDHANSKILAKGLAKIDGITVEESQTNLLFINISGLGITGTQFKQDLAKHGIIVSSRWNDRFRLVTHYGIEKDDIEFVIETIVNLYSKK